MNYLPKKAWLFLVFIWLVVQLFWLYTFGIYIEEEAVVYINIAGRIASGDWQHSVHYWLYAGYIAPMVVIKWVGLSIKWMYLIQLALSFFAFSCFIKILSTFSLSNTAKMAGAFLFATCPFFHSWNSHLYTDGYFGSLVVIALYWITQKFNGSRKAYWSLIILLVFICFIRPVGFLLIPVAIVYAFTRRIKPIRILVPVIWLFAFSFFVVYALQNGKDFFYPGHNLDLNIICGLPSDLQQFEVTPYREINSIPGYFWSNPGLTIRLFSQRLLKSLWMTRPYFSNSHNLVITVCCIVYYLTALIGLVYAFRKKMLNYLYIFLGMAVWLIPNILLCADWHNRFMVPFMPFLLIVSTLGIDFLLNKKGLKETAIK